MGKQQRGAYELVALQILFHITLDCSEFDKLRSTEESFPELRV